MNDIVNTEYAQCYKVVVVLGKDIQTFDNCLYRMHPNGFVELVVETKLTKDNTYTDVRRQTMFKLGDISRIDVYEKLSETIVIENEDNNVVSLHRD